MSHRAKAEGRLGAIVDELSGWRARLLSDALARHVKRFES
jgi:hypothetical protein